MAPSLLLRWLGLAVLTYVFICAAMYLLQHRLQYRPNASPDDPTAARVPGMSAETLLTPDGERLVAWWRPPRDAASPVFLYLPGNGANLMSRDGRLRRLAARGGGFLALSWRGYGGSTGTPSEQGLRTDARTAYTLLGARVDPARIVIFGESLGTTVAVALAAEAQPAAVVLDSGFASVLDVAERRYWWLPVRWLLREPFRADLAAPSVKAPVLQVHCRTDPVTPFDSATRLNALLPVTQPIMVVEGRCHTPSLLSLEERLWTFVGAVLAR